MKKLTEDQLKNRIDNYIKLGHRIIRKGDTYATFEDGKVMRYTYDSGF